MTDIVLLLAQVFAVSVALCILILGTVRWHGTFSFDYLEGVQKLHESPTPRIGGLAIMVAFAAAVLLVEGEVRTLLRNLSILGFIVFSFGFTEDLTKKVSVPLRLWASFMPAVVGYFVAGVVLRQIGLEPIDYLLSFNPVAIVFTAFAVGGVTHAINIVDGLNGLCAWVSIWALAAILAIALQVGDVDLALCCAVIMVSIVGFLLFNWPLGKLFLGDGGSYLLGLSVAWMSVLLTVRNPTVSPFALLLISIYPITEVLYSIYRRKKIKQSPGVPDQLHLHQLVASSVVYPCFTSLSKTSKNSLSGFLMSLLMLVPGLSAILLYQSPSALLLCIGLSVMAYLLLYWQCFYRYSQKGKFAQ